MEFPTFLVSPKNGSVFVCNALNRTSLAAAAGLANVEVLRESFLCDGQGAVRRAILSL